MIRFEVGGEYLDLPADFSLQFKKKNVLFAFDDIECERSTSFDIPATPQNNRIFSLAKWVQSDGTGMRRKYEAQMQAGAVVRDGYLHIDQYSAGKYKAVFVTGELLGLKDLRDAGKIKEYYKPAGGIVWSTANIKDANTSAGQLSLAITKYLTNVALLHPSFDLGDLMQNAYKQLTGRNLPAYTRGYRLVPKEVQSMEKTTVTVKNEGTDANTAPTASQAVLANALTSSGFLLAVDTFDTVLMIGEGGMSIQYRYIKVRQFRARQTIVLTFPANFPSNYFLMSIEDKGGTGEDPQYNVLSPAWFLGGYSFHQSGSSGTARTGTPLAGQSVTIPTGTPFVLLSDDQFEYDSTFHWNGFRYISDSAYDYEFELIAEGDEIAAGDVVRALDILPELTLTELLKMYTYLEGKVLNYTEADGILFDDLDVANWANFDLTGKVIDESAMSRKFGDYAQRNLVQFASGSDVVANQRVAISYDIDNDNLLEEKTLGKIPFSEGQVAEKEGFIVARFDAEDTEKNTLYADGIMIAVGLPTTAPTYATRVNLPKNSGLQSLCDASTSQTIRARMSYLEYEQISPKTAIFFDGVRYVWTESNWSKGVATFKLSKISA